MTEERSPGEDCFDMMVEGLKNEPASTPCVFSDQMGRGRTTAGMIAACLIKEIQITTELRSVELAQHRFLKPPAGNCLCVGVPISCLLTMFRCVHV